MQGNSLPVRVDVVSTPLSATFATSPADRLESVLSDLVSRGGHGPHGDDGGGMPSPGADSLVVMDSRAPSPVGSHVSNAGMLGGGIAVGLAYGMSATPSVAASIAASDAGEAEAARQDMQELRRHLAVLHNVQQAGTAAGMCSACHAIQSLMGEKAEVKQCVLGPVSWRECSGCEGCMRRLVGATDGC